MKRPRIFQPLFEKIEIQKAVSDQLSSSKKQAKKRSIQPPKPSATEQCIAASVQQGELTEEEAQTIPDLEADTLVKWGQMDYVGPMGKIREWIDAEEWSTVGEYLVDRKRYNPVFAHTVTRHFGSQYTFSEHPPRYEAPWPEDMFEALSPHLLCDYTDGETTYRFGIATCWRPRFTRHGLAALSKVQFVRFKLFEQETGIPVFMIFGIGGTAEQPEQYFQIPFRHMENSFIPKPIALRNKHDINKPFYYIPEVKRLF
ncbi:MAG: hypothetical protein NC038_06580 [Paludibacter sp.]|nr:hypothetical protein [Bacteroidales bacterium]MCM1069566.1 hypothetical protein [Prevotella sp.]MCM1354212.1 hypothetical protein [Bacteroides sp.]MCM1443049.1 hypothetical protein [Muribaculum sp.]MCM1482286.1 hypothetical protein [Paludibacter sp.]